MNYEKNYYDYINYVKTLNRKRGDGNYYERHHIKPKSIFPELAKDKDNLVLLTAREHFLAHYLLCKIYSEGKEHFQMLCAFQRMTKNTSKVNNLLYMNSRLFEKMKTELVEQRREFSKRMMSDPEIKKRILDKTHQWQREHPRQWTEEQRLQISESLKRRHKENPEILQHLSEINKGKKHSEETKLKMSKSRMGHPVSEETRMKLRQQHSTGIPVVNIITGETYPSALNAEKLTGVPRHMIRKSIRLGCPDLNGGIWEVLEK